MQVVNDSISHKEERVTTIAVEDPILLAAVDRSVIEEVEEAETMKIEAMKRIQKVHLILEHLAVLCHLRAM
jgi:hypothetical protein